ncbi:hypothetical protein V3C99_004018 [Haemonchus contortus]|uniref:Uncharacterized protein n=1 Tax=Haemonchus contortus TaxID=6289 RepID=A0A7I4XZH7_HAECO
MKISPEDLFRRCNRCSLAGILVMHILRRSSTRKWAAFVCSGRGKDIFKKGDIHISVRRTRNFEKWCYGIKSSEPSNSVLVLFVCFFFRTEIRSTS